MTTSKRPSDRKASPAASEPGSFLSSTGYLLAHIGRESRRLWAQMLAEEGLTPHQFAVLMSLGNLGATSQQHLCRVVGVDPRNAVSVFDLLQERGLIERRPDPTDRRRHAVKLTPAGRTMIDELGRTGAALEREMLKALSESERTQLHELLLKLFVGMDEG